MAEETNEHSGRKVTIRSFREDDLDSLIDLFRNTIHNVNIQDYTQDQVDAWAPEYIDKNRWMRILTDGFAIVAEVNGELAGFTNLMSNGHIHFLFISHNHQRMGIATLLLYRIEFEAIQLGSSKMSTDSSITARPFFEKMGFTVLRPQKSEFNGEVFDNFKMEKELT